MEFSFLYDRKASVHQETLAFSTSSQMRLRIRRQLRCIQNPWPEENRGNGDKAERRK